jgi:putative membrane protein
MKPKNMIGCIVVCGLLAVGGTAQTSSTSKMDASAESASTATSKLSAADRQFVKKAAEGGLAEVELGKLATERASSEEVKRFGQRMVDDHTKSQ